MALRQKVIKMIWSDIFSHIPPKVFEKAYLQYSSTLLNASISHHGTILSLSSLILSIYGIMKTESWTETLNERVREWFERKKVSPIQKDVFETLFKEKDSYAGVYGTDARRLGVAVKGHHDDYGWAEWLQCDFMSLTEFDELLQKAGIVERPEKIAQSERNFNDFAIDRNLHSAGGPVPSKITAEIMRNLPLRFDLHDPNYPLHTLRAEEEPYKSDYGKYNGKYQYHSDYGIIVVGSNPRDNSKKALGTFGCHGYGSLAAAKAISLDKHFKILDQEYEISKVDKGVINDIQDGLKRGMNFYIVVEAEIEKGQIVSISKCEGPIFDSAWSKEDLNRFKQLSKDGEPL